jgi:hypothetical protein
MPTQKGLNLAMTRSGKLCAIVEEEIDLEKRNYLYTSLFSHSDQQLEAPKINFMLQDGVVM